MPAHNKPMATSKSFRAVLPSLAAGDIDRLRRYCDANFAACAVFQDRPGDRAECTAGDHAQVIWLATRDRTRSAAAHRRSARGVLAKLRISAAGLKGWLVLAADEAVRAEHSAHMPNEAHAPRPAVDEAKRSPPGIRRESCTTVVAQDASGSDVKVVHLGRAGGPRRGKSQFSLEVLR